MCLIWGSQSGCWFISCFIYVYVFLDKYVRLFLKPLVLSCPPEYYDSLLRPLLGPLFTYMMQVTILFFNT